MASILSKFFQKEISRQVNARLSSPETDNNFYIGGRSANDVFKDRLETDRSFIIEQALLAWRTSPIARRVVGLTNEFVLGNGFNWDCEHRPTRKFLKDFYDHPLNKLDEQIPEWIDETTRSGDLFLLFSVDQAGMSYVRAIPSEQIKEIQCAENDYRQELYYIPADNRLSPWPAFDPDNQEQIYYMLHFPVNRPVGACFGESDLAPMLKWFGRLSTLVEDRVIQNHLRGLIVFVLSGTFTDENARKRRQSEINLHPPQPGSILVKDNSETWEILSPASDARDASIDILAVKKLIAAAIGIPLHYLAEPESSTRSTAEAAGTPAFRHFERRQEHFINVLKTVFQTACTVRRRTHHLPAKPIITIQAPDITERDNSLLSLAGARIEPVLGRLFDRNLIDEKTYLTLFYTFVDQSFDDTNIPKGLKAPLVTDQPDQSTQNENAVKPVSEEAEQEEEKVE